jgi:2-polyprenyl-3-methyl-5-hydroxy-6-metoxy-1,4-benzoquinol methylase
VIRAIAARMRERSHEARADLLLQLLPLPNGASVLDLGGSDGSFAARVHRRRPDLRITVADVEDTRLLAAERYGFAEARLDPDAALPFGDAAFDAVLCNSVIEHVTLPKQQCIELILDEAEWRHRALARQAQFAAEIERVGRAYFVQTPHPAFPIDAHTWLPLTNRLTHERVRRLIRATDRFWVKKCGVADWHLLDPTDMQRLFPGARIHVERLAGLPKSVIACRS